MMRRKLLAYTCMMTAGISAGYFITEKLRIFAGAEFLTAAAVALVLIADGGRVRRDCGERAECMERKELAVCFAFLIAGFMLFVINYAEFEACSAEVLKAGGGTEVKARVVSFTDRGDDVRLILREEGSSARFYTDYEPPEGADLSELISADVIVSGEAAEIRAADNPGCFDYRLYMRSKGVSYRIKARHAEVMPNNGLSARFRKYLYRSKEKFLAAFDEDSA